MNKIRQFLSYILGSSSRGAIALILVVMITALTIVSAVVISMVNTSDMMSSYALSEAEQSSVEMDACLEDALWRIASSTSVSGTYYLTNSTAGINCYYQIAVGAPNGLKTVTSTASTTSSIGYWENTVVVQVNVSSTPIRINSYKQSNKTYASYDVCGDGICSDSEEYATCSADCQPTAVCGNGIVEGSEVCDDGNTVTEYCGNHVRDIGKCNATCTATIPNETCDYGSKAIQESPGCYTNPIGCLNSTYRCDSCSHCVRFCEIIGWEL